MVHQPPPSAVFWRENRRGLKLRLKSLKSEGLALNMGTEGMDIRMT
jgi:hypothetical protein